MTQPPNQPTGAANPAPTVPTVQSELADLKQQQVFLRKRTGWILFWVVILFFFGGCGAYKDYTNQISDLDSQLNTLTEQVSLMKSNNQTTTRDLCAMIGQLSAKAGTQPPATDLKSGGPTRLSAANAAYKAAGGK